jgi:L-threonine kinase
MSLTIKSPGSCGELVQGTLDGQPFLITCPIDLYSEFRYKNKIPGFRTTLRGDKSREMLVRTLHYVQSQYTMEEYLVRFPFQQYSALPIGKGMASSSADLSCLCQAVALSLGTQLSADEMADLCLAVEPTDGIFYPGIMLFDHVGGKIRENLGQPPKMMIAVFDAGGEVDTLSFNKRSDLTALNKAKEKQVREAMDFVMRGIAKQDVLLIGQGATISALANQLILANSCLEPIIKISSQYGACGVNAAHSGTVLGVLFAPQQAHQIADCVIAVTAKCPKVKYLQTVHLVSGGVRIDRGDKHES